MTPLELAKIVVPKWLYPSALLRRRVQQRTRNEVHGGPFAGMRYVDRAIWGAYTPKLLGCYELELHPFIERLVAMTPSHVVDIGGAEGYYAVGLAMRLPASRVTVFEQLDSGRAAIAELARRNGVAERIDVRGSCDTTALRSCLEETGATALVSDVEGYEVDLLDPVLVPGLAKVTMLVEVHDSKVPGCAERVARKFAETHAITSVTQRRRTISDYPYRDVAASVAPSLVLKYGLNEFRSAGNGWLWMEPTPARGA